MTRAWQQVAVVAIWIIGEASESEILKNRDTRRSGCGSGICALDFEERL